MRRRTGFTLLELIVVLLVLGILAAISVPTFGRVKENSTVRAAQTTLEAAARSGEAIAASDRDASDEDIAAAVESEFADSGALTVSVGTGADADTVTVAQTSGSVIATGSVEFVDGVAVVTDATTSASSTTTSTTAAPVSYSVGDVGPAGGIIVSTPTINGIGLYYEVSPSDLSADVWCDLSLHGTDLAGAAGSLMGTGEQNTVDADVSCSTGAVQAAADYELNGYADWFIPSLQELGVVYNNRALIGSYVSAPYWSSTEDNGFYVWTINFADSAQNGGGKNSTHQLRVVRTFAG